ncbi:MAG: rhomboid family intramembrane serine protease [Methanomassiliicoccales archaeon]
MDPFSVAAILVIVGALIFSVWRRTDLAPVLILANLIVFMVTLLSPWNGLYAVQWDLGFRPIYLQTGENLYTIFTQMFIHGGIMHILFNMLFLYLIGVQLEERVGKTRFAAIYFVAGVAGVLFEALVQWGSGTVIIGASGAISGAMGAMLLLYPRDNIPFFLGPIFLPRVPVWIGVGGWFAIQVFLAFTDSSGGVAYAAHIGGFLIGAAVAQVTAVQRGGEEEVMDIDDLDPLATTPELRNALEHIREEENDDVRRAWLEYFAERAVCPRCGKRMEVRGNKVKCECGYSQTIGWRRSE